LTADGGVACEWQLAIGREDAQTVVRIGTCGGQYEGGFGQVVPVGDLLHLLARQAFGLQDDRQRVALESLGGEDVDLLER